MKNFDTMVGKYIRVAEKYCAYFYPKEQKNRLRTDDMEYVFWDEYMMLGGGYYQDKYCLFYKPLSVGYNTRHYAKARDYKTITKKEWKKELIWTVFEPNFEGVEGEGFFEMLKEHIR
jgi:hypothetical protein